MLEKWRKDRRVGYSFRAHFRRVVETKGLTRVALTLGATAIVAGTAFANCSSSDITGPSSDQPPASATPARPQADVTTEATITAKQPAPFRLPFAALPPTNPCTGEPVVWDHGSTMVQGTIQTSTALDGRLHVQFHLNAQGNGVSGPSATRVRRYSGSQEYNSQTLTVLATSTEKFMFEWNVKVIASGESGSLHPEDDFFLHVVSRFGPPPDFFPEAASATVPPGGCH